MFHIFEHMCWHIHYNYTNKLLCNIVVFFCGDLFNSSSALLLINCTNANSMVLGRKDPKNSLLNNNWWSHKHQLLDLLQPEYFHFQPSARGWSWPNKTTKIRRCFLVSVMKVTRCCVFLCCLSLSLSLSGSLSPVSNGQDHHQGGGTQWKD